jgi:uncharacterized protein YeaO (DUF488 family)
MMHLLYRRAQYRWTSTVPRWVRRTLSWDEYTVRYHEEMLAQEAAVRALRQKTREGTTTLLCFEREGDPCCHRHLLKKLIEKEGLF